MRYYEIVEKVVPVKEPRGSLCNKCGEPFEPYDNEILPFNVPLGYENWKYDLCYTCHLEFIRSFKIVPDGFKSDPNFTSSFDLNHDYHQQLFDEWKETGEWHSNENPIRDEWMGVDEEYYQENELNEIFEDSKPLPQATLKIVK